MKYFVKTFFLLAFASVLFSCEYETIEPIQVEVGDVSFATDVYPLFSSCTTCHAGSKQFDATTLEKAYTSLTTKNLVTAPSASSVLMSYVNNNHQGTANYSAEDKAKIAKWIDDGAKNN